MITESQALTAIFGMAAVTYLTRIGGLWLMAVIPLNKRVERFLEAMSGTVLVSILVPATLRGDGSAAIAIAGAIIVMVLTRQSLLAVISGIVIAALARQFI